MQCLSPIRIRHPTNEGEFIDVPCGKCLACLSRRRQQWVTRLQIEKLNSMSAKFITLTYSDESLPIYTDEETGEQQFALNKRDLQLWFKRLRKYIKTHYDEPVTLRYFAVGEYGSSTYRPHYHVILFNFPYDLDIIIALSETWKNGLTHVGEVTDKSISYVAKYVLCKDDMPYLVKPFMVCSKSIGIDYLTPERIKYHKEGLISFIELPSGARVTLPRYYKVKIFDSDEIVKINKDLHDYLFAKELDYIHRYGSQDEQALESGASMMRTQMKDNYVKNKKRGMTKGRKL